MQRKFKPGPTIVKEITEQLGSLYCKGHGKQASGYAAFTHTHTNSTSDRANHATLCCPCMCFPRGRSRRIKNVGTGVTVCGREGENVLQEVKEERNKTQWLAQ